MVFLKRILCLLLAAAATLTAATAQTPSTAGLRGRVLDDTGSPVPGVIMKLTTASAPSGARSAITDLEGVYRFATLPPARDYLLTASVPSYATVEAGPLELKVGKETRLDLTLKTTAELQETVKVEARGETVDTASTVSQTSFSAEFIEGLPLVGRSFEDLLTLAPGVTDPDGDGNVNVRGARDTGLQLRLDGTNINDPLSGHTGQSVNLETVEELEIITAGATAEYGRADGGFANVITKSGGNNTSGSFKFFYRSQFLDGTGAGRKDEEPIHFTDSNLYATLGGPVLKDHLWYFVALERFDEEVPEIFEDRTAALKTIKGWRNFAKLTWQASSAHKLTFQINQGPAEYLGNYIGETIDPEADYMLTNDGTLPQLTWTAILSPDLLMQVVFSYLDSRVEIDPVFGSDSPIETERAQDDNGILYARLPCTSLNCEEDGLRRLNRVQIPETDDYDQTEDGAYNVRNGVDLARATVKADFSYTLEDRLGQHGFKSGFLFESETYVEDLVVNPVIIDTTCNTTEPPCSPTRSGSPERVLTLQVYDPVQRDLAADSFNMGWYAQDSWKIRPNLTLNLGARLDWESATSFGYRSFDPHAETREAMRRYETVCQAALDAGYNCSHTPGRVNGVLSTPFVPLAGSPALDFDVNHDGRIDINGAERQIILVDPYTVPSERASQSFTIDNTNLSPRLSVSWDPWGDGRTKVFGTYGRYHDRLFLGAVVTDQKPTSWTATWLSDPPSDYARPGELSLPVSGSFSVPQTDRNLRTPYTDEWTAGFERELAPEWSVGVTYVNRNGENLLQDQDMNHITCPGFREVYGVDPSDVCGDGGQLEMDRFGTIAYAQSGGTVVSAILPNGAPDLYTLNPYFNQVLRVGNFNSSRYQAWELTLKKRLHRNWQMQGSYTWSTAEGEAESFSSVVGNDPAVSDKVAGYLSYDQRHIFKYQAVAHLPHEILVGGTLTWASGLPYTFVANTEDYDDHALLTPQRVFSVTGKLNDQRNESQLTIDGRVEKRFTAAGMQMTAFLAGENLLNRDELVLREVDRDQRGIQEGSRRFGRRFEIGASILF
ncbi:MAG: TonB-dependent receptor [Candidatus Polarisedimenticolia bacterium]